MDYDRNHILAKLEPDSLDLLRPHFELLGLTPGDVLIEADREIEWAYFVLGGLVSSIAANSGRSQYEIGVTGREGLTGIALLHCTDRSPVRSIVQIPGEALRIPRAAFEAAVDSDRAMRALLLKFCQAQFVQVAYTAISNSRDRVDTRLARWILMCRDRTGRDDLNLTHEFLSIMLGVRRAGVTTALHVLEGERAVRSTRGCVSIRDRTRLEELAGDSYGIPEREYERLLGRPITFG